MWTIEKKVDGSCCDPLIRCILILLTYNKNIALQSNEPALVLSHSYLDFFFYSLRKNRIFNGHALIFITLTANLKLNNHQRSRNFIKNTQSTLQERETLFIQELSYFLPLQVLRKGTRHNYAKSGRTWHRFQSGFFPFVKLRVAQVERKMANKENLSFFRDKNLQLRNY